jgi:hypothetical protein
MNGNVAAFSSLDSFNAVKNIYPGDKISVAQL